MKRSIFLFGLFLIFSQAAVAQSGGSVVDSVEVSVRGYTNGWFEAPYHNCTYGLLGTWVDVAEIDAGSYTIVNSGGEIYNPTWGNYEDDSNFDPRWTANFSGTTHDAFVTFTGGAQGGVPVSCTEGYGKALTHKSSIEPLWARYDIPDGTPVAIFKWAQTEGLTVAFDGTESHEATVDGKIPVQSYEWAVDGTTLSGATPSYPFPSPGTYSVQLTVTDDDGDEDDLTLSVEVRGVVLEVKEDIVAAETEVGDAIIVIGTVTNKGSVEARNVRVTPEFTFVNEFIESDPSNSTNATHAGPADDPTPIVFSSLGIGQSETVTQMYFVTNGAKTTCDPAEEDCPSNGIKPVRVEWEAQLLPVSGEDEFGEPARVNDLCPPGENDCANKTVITPQAVHAQITLSTTNGASEFTTGRARRWFYPTILTSFVNTIAGDTCFSGCVDVEIKVTDNEDAPVEGAVVALSEPNLTGYFGTGLLCADDASPVCGSSIILPATGADGIARARFWSPGVTSITSGSFKVTAQKEGFADAVETQNLSVKPSEVQCPEGGIHCFGKNQVALSSNEKTILGHLQTLTTSLDTGAFNETCELMYGVLNDAPGALVSSPVMSGLRNGILYTCGNARADLEETLGDNATFAQTQAEVQAALESLARLYKLYWFATRFEMPLTGVIEINSASSLTPPFLSVGGDFSEAIFETGDLLGNQPATNPSASINIYEVSYRSSESEFNDGLYFDLSSGSGEVSRHIQAGYDASQWLVWDNNGKRFLTESPLDDRTIVLRFGESTAAAKSAAQLPPVEIDYGPGDVLVINPGTDLAEKIQIASMADSTITLTTPLRNSHEAGAAVIKVDSLDHLAPDAPVSISGLAGRPGVETSPTLRWFNRAPASSYSVEVATDSLFANLVESHADLDTTALAIGPLDTPATYYWRVSAANELGDGPWSQAYKLVTGAPEGDDLAEAHILSDDLPTSHIAWNVATSLEGGEAESSCGVGSNSIWFSLTPSASGTIAIESFESDFDTVLSVWSGDSHPLTEVTCNDDWEDGKGRVVEQSYVDFGATGGTTYYVRVTGVDGDEGLAVLRTREATTVDVETEDTPLPVSLAANVYPNPVTLSGTIQIEQPEESLVRAELYDMLGRRLRTIADGRLASGVHRVPFDAGSMSAGVYILKVSSDSGTVAKTFTVVR